MEPTGGLPPHRHLALVGLMGVGKTSVGAAVAARSGRRHVDLDRAVTQLAGRSIGVIFHEGGETAFRGYEQEALSMQLAAEDPMVLSTGGGVLGRGSNRALLASSATVVWLRATPETLVGRVGDPAGRPLLADGEPLEVLRRLADERGPAYGTAADVVLDTDGLTVDEVASMVLDAVAATSGVTR
jgi:shikimate kinase|tara:strand:+ start:4805 stop:5359 length:555 start_codon:yes stop_codon:yes gene_type:complete